MQTPSHLLQLAYKRLLRRDEFLCDQRTAIYLKEEQLKKLQAISDKTGAPVAELIRRAIDAYLKGR